jgi:ferritin
MIDISVQLDNYINEAIELELHVAELYLLFFTSFPPDADFWWKLSLEEKNHASILKSLKTLYRVVKRIPAEFTPENPDALKITNQKIRSVISTFKEHPSREAAFMIACDIESSAGELEYQTFVENQSLESIYKVFQKLNGEDKDHAERIREYMKANNILTKQ